MVAWVQQDTDRKAKILEVMYRSTLNLCLPVLLLLRKDLMQMNDVHPFPGLKACLSIEEQRKKYYLSLVKKS